MGGKAAILLVLGFSLIFLVIGHNFNNILNRSIDNSIRYYTETNAYNIAVAGANMAAAEIFNNNEWDDGFTDVPYNGGTMTVTVANPLAGSGGKITICHIPPGNPDARHTIEIPQKALPAHLAHGDFIGTCGGGTPTASDPAMIEILAEGKYNGIEKMVAVKLLPSKFSKFAYYSAYEPSNIWWTTGDTVWGPMHVQGDLRIANSPVFYGKVTLEGSVESYGHWEYIEVGGYWTWQRVGHGRDRSWEQVWVSQYEWQYISTSDPQFYGGLEQGISVPLPTDGVSDVEVAANTGGHVFSGQDTVIITFKADSINYKFTASDPTGTTVLASDLAPNGAIFVDNGTARISGTVSGRYTLGVDGLKAHGKGNLYFDDDIVYENDPRTHPNSSDLLGLVVKNAALITDNAVNNSDINIHASVYVESGGFGAEHHSTRPASGNINLLGGIIQAERFAVGTFDASGTTTGFNKRYRYDNRLLRISPPFFPGTGMYEIVSWYE